MQGFEFIKDTHTRHMISNGYQAIDELELWSWLKSFVPKENEGFMWSSDPNIYKIIQKMESLPNPPGHSGSSVGFTMRELHFIAKNGIDEYKNQVEQNN